MILSKVNSVLSVTTHLLQIHFNIIIPFTSWFYINCFNHFGGKSKFSAEIWLRNEGLPDRESLYELYIWFCQKRDFEKNLAIAELNILGEHMRSIKEENLYKERIRREFRK